jgi:hypothetical protein
VFLPRIVSRVSPVFPQHLEHIEVTRASFVLHRADTYTRAEMSVISCFIRPKFPVYDQLHYYYIIIIIITLHYVYSVRLLMPFQQVSSSYWPVLQ